VKAATIPEVVLDNGVRIHVICGEINGISGPVTDIIIDPEYLDITVPAGTEYFHPTKKGHTVFIYVIGGKGVTGESGEAGKQGSGEAGSHGERETRRWGDRERKLLKIRR
jgi:hypothetical protein